MAEYRIPAREELHEGQEITWIHQMRGGYGYAQPVPAAVVKATPKRVTIDALRKDGSTARRSVKPESLRVKETGDEFLEAHSSCLEMLS